MSKPVGTVTGWYGGYPVIDPVDGWIPAVGTVLYSAPPARKPLTDDEIMLMANDTSGQHWGTEAHIVRLVRAIERKHGVGSD